ncbi:YrhK family protein [Citreimonas salinaria]|uniref:YrhK-like protein n=1 Tax=Citreimonas salinaria TaxID=321339 RepID=A0A1H3M5R6_9RHOB|nr:YrhK family protein [Citreimonas salinaria]SDY71345.1 YrhK-like protein [Citreimonas salinaria]
MGSAIKTLVQDFGWIHTGLGMFGNISFFVGSIMFLPSLGTWRAVGMEWQTIGVWLFIVGAFFMLVGALGNFLVKIYEKKDAS